MSECEFPTGNASSDEIDSILKTAKTIAVIGLSPKEDRPSHYVSKYMKEHGYRVIPVNPGQTTLLGETCYRSLLDVPEDVDVVDIFREASAVPEIVDQAIAKKAKAVWMQSGIVHNAAAEKARAAGLQVVMNKCVMVEHRRALGGQ